MLAGCECSGMVAREFARTGWEAYSCDILPGEQPDEDFPSGGTYRHIQGSILDDPEAGTVGPLSPDHPVNWGRKAAGMVLDGPVRLWDLGAFFPPCTHISQAGAVWWKHKDATRGGDGRMQEGAAFFMQMVNLGKAACSFSAVENPVGAMGLPSQACYYRRPDQVVQPHMFGDPLIKATCLWLEGLPLLVADNPVEPAGRVASGGGSCRTDIAAGRGMKFVNGHEDAKGRVNRQRERNRTLPGFARAMASQWTAWIEEQEARA
jgi:hypothetical protein